MVQQAGAPVTQTTCAYCGVGCGVAASINDRDARQLAVSGDHAHPANFGGLCSKGVALNETLAPEGRLLRPRIGGRDAFWGEALDLVAVTLAKVRAEHGPEAIAFYLSGQLLTEDYYVVNKLAKGFLGTANIDTNTRLCMAATEVAQQHAFGEDVVPGCYEDLDIADLVVLVGSNTAWCHPVLFQRIKAAREKRGARVVVIDPRRTPTCEIADLHLAIRPGSDAALFNGLLVWLADHGALDASFLALHTRGYSGALDAARADAGDIEALARRCDVPLADLQAFFRLYTRTPKTVSVWSQGINQSTAGSDQVNAIINVHLATGRIGKPGATPLSLSGQANAMGGREVGGVATQLAAHMSIEDVAARAAVARFWLARDLPAGKGLKAIDMFEAIHRGKVKFLWVMGTNPATSLPDADRVKEAIARCQFVVVSDVVADNDTLKHAHVALPAQAWGEKDGTITNSERRISRQRALVAPVGEARPDWWALAQVARRLGFTAPFNYTKPAEIFREHARLSALGNEPGKARRLFDIGALARLDDEGYEALAPLQWPARGDNREGKRADSSRLFADGRFMHPDGRARFIAIAPHAPANATRVELPLALNTHRLRDQWHTMTRTGLVPRLARHAEEPALDVHPEDAKVFGVVDGGFVETISEQGRALLRVCVSETQRRGEVSAPMHWTRTMAPSSCVNALVNRDCDPRSGQPELKHTPVRVGPWMAALEAVALVRNPQAMPIADYVVRGEEDGCSRFRLALRARPASLLSWLQKQVQAMRGTATQNHKWLLREDAAQGRAVVAGFVDGRLVAFAAAQADSVDGEVKPAPHVSTRLQWLRELVARGSLDDEAKNWLLTDFLPPGATPCSRQLCACFQVTEQQLRSAVAAGANSTVALVGKTGAGSTCGICLPEIGRWLAEQQTAKARNGRRRRDRPGLRG